MSRDDARSVYLAGTGRTSLDAGMKQLTGVDELTQTADGTRRPLVTSPRKQEPEG